MEDMVSKLKSPRRVMLLVKGKKLMTCNVALAGEWKTTQNDFRPSVKNSIKFDLLSIYARKCVEGKPSRFSSCE